MSETILINLPLLSGLNNLPKDFVKRDASIHQIEKLLELNDLIFIQGESGIGKTTLLTDFIYQNPNKAISHFIDKNYNFTSSFDCIVDNIYRQIYFYCFNDELEESVSVDLALFNSVQSRLYKKIRQNQFKGENLYFIFDGFENLNLSQLESLFPIFDNLPWGKAKFVFTGSNENLASLFQSKKINSKEINLMNFGINETNEYFKEFKPSNEQILEIHKLGNKGFPASLKEIKLLCNKYGSIESYFSSGDFESDVFLNHWKIVNEDDTIQILTLAVLAFSDTPINLDLISKIINETKEVIILKISDLPFIDLNEEKIDFQTDSLRTFIKNKLHNYEDEVNSLLIDYYEENPENDESRFNLPNLYRKAKSWEKLTKFFEAGAFVYLLEKHQSMGNLNTQFAVGLEDAKNTNQKFNEALLKFSLHKSSVKDLEKHQLWESEVEARMLIGDYEQALTLANSAFVKEERLKLFATLAKHRKIKGLQEDLDLNAQIKDLYFQIDFTKIREKAFEIAALLLYCDLELAINLVEQVSDNSASKNSLDYAFAYLTIFANEANRKSKSQVADLDLINSKIQNAEVKNITTALRFLTDEYTFQDLITNIEILSNFNQKLFLLKNWIINNKTNKEVHHVIKFTLEEIIKASSENVPNATSLAEISIPLPLIEEKEKIKELVELFDVQRNTIDRPTKDYVKLQLNIAEALLKISFEDAKERIFDIYIFISDLVDLSIKTDCLSLLWVWLSKNDGEKKIETLLSPNESIEFQTRKNIDLLLNETAFHFKMVEFVVINLASNYPDFVIETIDKLNTQQRRDYSFKIANENYLRNKKISDLDFSIINKFHRKTISPLIKEDIIIEVIDKFFFDKDDGNIIHIPKILPYYELISKITKIGNKCYIITHAIKILNREPEKYSSKIELLKKELHESWEKVDIHWEKIELAFHIAKDIAEYSEEEAKKYIKLATELRSSEVFSSNTSVEPYINSIKLTIRAFCGILLTREDVIEDIKKISSLIEKLESTGEKLKLWSELSLRVLSLNKKELFDKIFKENINPLLSIWGKNLLDVYKSSAITIISPAIYYYNQSLFFSDYLPLLNSYEKDFAIKNILDYILTSQVFDDPIDDKQNFANIDYPKLNELCTLCENFSNDFILNKYLTFIVKAIKNNKSDLTKEQLSSLKDKLKNVINIKFPSIDGIRHEGYKIVSEAEVLSLGGNNQSDWDNLIQRARRIPNLSDKALVLTILSDKISDSKKSKGKKIKLDLLDEAFNFIKTIPSVYDKSNRFDATWETFLDIDRGKFMQYIRLAYKDLLTSKDGEIDGLRSLIDVAQQHDPELAKEFVTMLDQDSARKKLKQPFLNRIKNKETIKSACDQFNNISKLNTPQFKEVSRKFLEGLNSGKRTTKDIFETYELIEKASNLPLSDSFETYMYFIHNANKRFETNKQNPENLSAIFNATYENSKLIGILSSDNLNKMKNLFSTKHSSENTNISNKIFGIGEKKEAIQFIKDWLSLNINQMMYFIDPYFTEADLELLNWIKEYNPECQIKILTGKKKSEKNDYKDLDNPEISANKEHYLRAWKEISTEKPITTDIIIVFDKENYTCPIHDRWLVAGEAQSCLYIGTSLNGLGNRESQITKLEKIDDLSPIKDIIDKYIHKKDRKSGMLSLKYEEFDLDID